MDLTDARLEYNNYVLNKRIAVVGPADYVTKYQQGDLIDNYDIVMRFNAALPVGEDMIKYVGSRTDILGNCLDNSPRGCGRIDYDLWKESGVKWLFCPHTADGRFEKRVPKVVIASKKYNISVCDGGGLEERIQSDIKTRPQTGLVSVMYLLEQNVKEVYLTGFSFGAGKHAHYKGYKPDLDRGDPKRLASSVHNQKKALDYFKTQYKLHNRVLQVDNTLHDILT
jgi:hypothetical protein